MKILFLLLYRETWHAFPRGKGGVYQAAKCPASMRGRRGIKSSGREISDFVSSLGICLPTFLDCLTGISVPKGGGFLKV